jgi:hypothetical protein
MVGLVPLLLLLPCVASQQIVLNVVVLPGALSPPDLYPSHPSQGCHRKPCRGSAERSTGQHEYPRTTKTCYTCPDLHVALAQAEQLQQGQDVRVVFDGVQHDGPYAVRAPGPGTGTLELRGASSSAVLDGGASHSMLAVTHGAINITNIIFRNGLVNATDSSWYRATASKAPVAVLAKRASFINCTFEHNRGVNGGALLLEGGTHTLQDCHFLDNQGYGGGDGGAHDTGGGGAVMAVRSTLEIRHSTFENNVATDPPGTPRQKGHPGKIAPGKSGREGLGHTGTHHGGAVMGIEAHIIARDSTFARGNAYQGGALYMWMWGTIEAYNSTFINNSAIGATHNTGGAIFSDRGSVLLRGGRFVGNVANASGGAIFAWSAHGSCKNVTVGDKHTPPQQSCQNITIEDVDFVDNRALGRAGGGVLGNQWSTFVVRNCSCRKNSYPAIWTDGGSSTRMTNSPTCRGSDLQ